jgi:hypothetical protein
VALWLAVAARSAWQHNGQLHEGMGLGRRFPLLSSQGDNYWDRIAEGYSISSTGKMRRWVNTRQTMRTTKVSMAWWIAENALDFSFGESPGGLFIGAVRGAGCSDIAVNSHL